MYSAAVIRINGVVQGVGFRFFVCRIAEALSLTGTVRNVSDGSVEVRVEGMHSGILSLIKDLEIGNRFSKVESLHVDWIPYSASYNKFAIIR